MGSLQKLGEIDRELESFGKSEELLGGVRRLARELAPRDLEAIDVALAELGVPVAELGLAAPIEVRARVETVAPVGGDAKPGTWERPERSEPFPDEGSGLVEVPDEVLRAETLPPVLELDPELLGAVSPLEDVSPVLEDVSPVLEDASPAFVDSPRTEPALFEDSTEVRDPRDLESEVLGGDMHDTGETPLFAEASSPREEERSLAADLPLELDLPLDDEGSAPLASLFDDEPALDGESASALEGSGGLADLFGESERPEAEPGAHEDLSDLLSSELRSALSDSEAPQPILGGYELDDEPEQTAIFTSDQMRALQSDRPPGPEDGSLEAQLDALVGDSSASSDDDFEMMIDEDVLALDDAEIEDADADDELQIEDEAAARASASQPPGSPSQPPKGFFSRILNRK